MHILDLDIRWTIMRKNSSPLLLVPLLVNLILLNPDAPWTMLRENTVSPLAPLCGLPFTGQHYWPPYWSPFTSLPSWSSFFF